MWYCAVSDCTNAPISWFLIRPVRRFSSFEMFDDLRLEQSNDGFDQPFGLAKGKIAHASVRVVDQAVLCRTAAADGLVEGVKHELRRHRG